MTSFLGLYVRPGYLEVSEAESGENFQFIASRVLEKNEKIASQIVSLLKDKSLGLKKSYEGVALVINSGNEIYRKLIFPFSKEHVEKTVRFEYFDQVNDSLRGTMEEYAFDYRILSSAEQKTSLLGVCSPESPIQELISGLEKLDLDPEKVIPELSALTTFLKMTIPVVASGQTMVLHTTSEEVYFLQMKSGDIDEFRQLKIKLGDIRVVASEKQRSPANAYQKNAKPEKLEKVKSEYEEEETFYKIASFTKQEMEEIKEAKSSSVEEVKEAEPLKEPSEVKKNALKRLLIQLQRTLHLMPAVPSELIISGTYANDKELLDAIHSFGLRVFEADVDLERAVSLGAALSFFDRDHSVINLRQGNLEYKGFFEKIVSPLTVCMVLLLSLTVVMNIFLIQRTQSLEKEKASYVAHAQKIARVVDPSNEAFKKNIGLDKINKQLNSLRSKVDFEANVNEYEKRHPIISCLKVWLEYEKTKNNAMTKKIAISNEQNIVIAQTSTGAKMDVSKARAAGFQEAVDFVKLLKSLKYFDESKDKEMKQDIANSEVVFDFYVQKNYEGTP